MELKSYKGLKIVFWNAQSQVNKGDDVKDIITQNNLDILIIVESWLREEISDNFISINDYNLIRQDRCSTTDNNIIKKGGGICFYIKNTIPYELNWDDHKNVNSPNLEMLTVKLNIPNLRSIFITAVYRSPTGSLPIVKQHMYELLNVITLPRKTDIFLGGDFNIDYNRNNDSKKLLKEMETKYGLTQLITVKSRPLYNNSIIDLIFVNNPELTMSGSLNYNISDHIPIFVVRKKIKIKPTKVEFFGRNYRNYSKDTLAARMGEIDWNDLLLLTNPDTIWETLYKRILTIVNDICPFRKSKYNKSRPPWITQELMELANDRDYCMALAKKKPLDTIILRAKSLRNEAKAAFKRVKEDYIKSRLEEFKDNPKKFWQEMANVIPSSHQVSNIILYEEDGTVLSKDNTPNFVNDYFSTIGQKLADDIGELSILEQQAIHDVMQLHVQRLPGLAINHFSIDEVIKEINKIDIYKASGMPEISSRLVKDAFSIIPDTIQHLFNCSLNTGLFPKSLESGYCNSHSKNNEPACTFRLETNYTIAYPWENVGTTCSQ